MSSCLINGSNNADTCKRTWSTEANNPNQQYALQQVAMEHNRADEISRLEPHSDAHLANNVTPFANTQVAAVGGIQGRRRDLKVVNVLVIRVHARNVARASARAGAATAATAGLQTPGSHVTDFNFVHL